MDLEQILTFLFGQNPGGMTFPPGTEARAAAMASERDQARAKAELGASQMAEGKGVGAKRKLTPEEQALQELLNSPRGQNFGR